jgi:zinc protease
VITETEVDGVQTLLASANGPIQAGLTFRVGLADKALPRTGIAHLVEHLALFRHGLGDYHYNGATGAITTSFHLEGSADDVVAFVDGVCRSLADLPVARLETEKSILETEKGGQSRGVVGELAPGATGLAAMGCSASTSSA